MIPKLSQPESRDFVARTRLPWVLAVFVVIAMYAVGYSLDSDRSQSEQDGVVSQTEADNGVIPSLPPQ